jgi:hypothetical protein
LTAVTATTTSTTTATITPGDRTLQQERAFLFFVIGELILALPPLQSLPPLLSLSPTLTAVTATTTSTNTATITVTTTVRTTTYKDSPQRQFPQFIFFTTTLSDTTSLYKRNRSVDITATIYILQWILL